MNNDDSDIGHSQHNIGGKYNDGDILWVSITQRYIKNKNKGDGDMTERKWYKTDNSEWRYRANGYIAVIEKKGQYYVGGCYINNKKSEYLDLKFHFPRRRLLKDIKRMVEENTKFADLPLTKPIKQLYYKTNTVIADDDMWWNN